MKRFPLLWLHNPLDLLLYDRNIIGSSSEIFGYLRKCSENVRKRSSGLRTGFEESSEIFRKCSEIFEKSSKTLSLVCLYNKQNIAYPLVDATFIFSCSSRYLTSERSGHVISSISDTDITFNSVKICDIEFYYMAR